MSEIIFEGKQVESVYSGKHGCCCGCRGNHVDASELPNSVKSFLKRFQKKATEYPIERPEGHNFISIKTETRTLIVYFKS